MNATCHCPGCRQFRLSERRRRLANFDPGVGGGVDRDKLPPHDFAGPHQTFPIVTPQDVKDAAHLVGHTANPEAVKAKITALARAKGPEFAKRLPADWKKKASPVEMGGPGSGPQPGRTNASGQDLSKAKAGVVTRADQINQAGQRAGKLPAPGASPAARYAQQQQARQALKKNGGKLADTKVSPTHPINPNKIKPPKGSAPAPGKTIGAIQGPGGANGGAAPAAAPAAMKEVKMDWLPEKQFQKQQKGLKKSIATRKKNDKLDAARVARVAPVQMGGPGSGPKPGVGTRVKQAVQHAAQAVAKAYKKSGATSGRFAPNKGPRDPWD